MKTRAQKETICAELHEKFGKATVAILTHCDGMPVEEINGLRRELRSAGGEFRVVKNTIARRAAEGTAVALATEAFEGPIAVTLGYGDPVPPAKVLRTYVAKHERLRIRLGVVEGQACDAARIAAIASMPSRAVLVGKLAGTLNAPITQLAGTLQAVVASLARVLSATAQARSADSPKTT
ncbi:MAG: 50S ribosomal protein L10 [Nitrospirota bacterium]